MKLALIGKKERPEFKEVLDDCRKLENERRATLVYCERFGCCEDMGDVDLFILFRSFPNEFNANDVEKLRRVAPLAPILIVAGTLCEGEERTGESFSGVHRFYTTEWRFEASRELSRFLDPKGAKGAFAQPATTTRVDRWSSDPSSFVFSDDLPKSVLIITDDRALATTLSESCETLGVDFRTQRLKVAEKGRDPEFRPELVVIDAVSLDDPFICNLVEKIRTELKDVVIEALTFAPRADEIAAWKEKGVRVLSSSFAVGAFLFSDAKDRTDCIIS